MDFNQITEMVYMYLPMLTTIIGVLATFIKIGSALKKNVKKQNEILSSQLSSATARTEELINEISKVKKYENETNE